MSDNPYYGMPVVSVGGDYGMPGEGEVTGFCMPIEHAGGVAAKPWQDKSVDLEWLHQEAEAEREVDAKKLLYDLGVQPMIAFKMFPVPSGIYYSLGMLAFGYFTHVGQIVTFLRHDDYVTAGLMTIVLVVAWYNSYRLFFRQGLVQGWKVLRARIRRSIRSGVQDPDIMALVDLGSAITGAFSTLLAPYRMLGISSLSWPSACNALMGLLLHTKSLADEMMGSHLGDLQRQFGRSVVKSQPNGSQASTLLQFWCLATMGAQVSLTAFVAHLWNPWVAALLFAPAALAFAAENQRVMACSLTPRSFPYLVLTAYLQPRALMAPVQSSVFGLHQWDDALEVNMGNVPALSHCTAQALRLAGVAYLYIAHQPESLETDVLEPAARVLHFDGASASDFFRACLLAFALATVAPWLLGAQKLLATNAFFREGQRSEEACQRMDDMKQQVDAALQAGP